jgi:hypothetical protein
MSWIRNTRPPVPVLEVGEVRVEEYDDGHEHEHVGVNLSRLVPGPGHNLPVDLAVSRLHRRVVRPVLREEVVIARHLRITVNTRETGN